MVKRLRCVMRRYKQRLTIGARWDGHYWLGDERGVVCLDCGKREDT